MLIGNRDGTIYISGTIFAKEDTVVLEKAVLAAFAAGNPVITLDMHEVKYMDAAAVGTIVKVYNVLITQSGHMRIIGVHGIVWELICLTKLDRILHVQRRQNSREVASKRRFYKIRSQLRNS